MGKRGTVTLAELLAVVALLLVAGAVLAVAVNRQRAAREEAGGFAVGATYAS